MQRTETLHHEINLAIDGDSQIQKGELKVGLGLFGTMLSGLALAHPVGATYHTLTLVLFGLNSIMTASGVIDIANGRDELAHAVNAIAGVAVQQPTITTRIYGMFSASTPTLTAPDAATPSTSSNPSSPLLKKA